MFSTIFPLLAFTFGSPWLLGGLALGGIPILIHLLQKRKFQETSWAAMKFLLAATRKHSRRIRLEQFILLAVRTLMLLLIALAFARPHVESLGIAVDSEVITHRIIVLDASLSMNYRPASETRFEKAREIAREIVTHANQGDPINLVQISQQTPHAIIKRPAYQHAQVIQEIEQLRQTVQVGDVVTTLQEVSDLLKEKTDADRQVVYLITDFQRTNWSTPELSGDIKQRLRKIEDTAELVLFNLGETDTPNNAVTRFATETPLVTLEKRIPLNVTVNNFSDTEQRQLPLQLFVDGRKVAEQRIDLKAGEERTFPFSHLFHSDAGTTDVQEHQLEVRLQDDGLPADNSRWLSLPARADLNVLLVNGLQTGDVSQWATHYVRVALAPGKANERSHLFRPRVISEQELTGVDLSHIDCLFLCNVAIISPQEARLLESYVKSGGALVICLGHQVDLASYNKELFQDGKGILPAELLRRVGNALNPTLETTTTFAAQNLEHPIVNAFQGNPQSGLETTLIFEYIQTKVAEKSTTESVLAFETGDAAILEKPEGKGRVILLTTSVDARWSTWARENSSFVPLVQEVVKFGVSGRWSDRQLNLGEPIVRGYPKRNLNLSATITTPDGLEEIPQSLTDSQFHQLRFEDTYQAGIYELKVGPPVQETSYFALNTNPVESRLSSLTQDELEEELFTEKAFHYHTDFHELHQETGGTQQGGTLNRYLLLAAFCLLLVEQLMAWKFLPGLLLLGGLVIVGLLWQIFVLQTLWGLLLLIPVLICAGGIWRLLVRRNLAAV